MDIFEMHIGLQEGLDKSDANSIPFLEDEHKDFWLNKAARRFKKTRYTPNNNRRQGFEKVQKRIDDVRTVVVRQSNGVQPFAPEADVYTFDIPQRYDYLATARFFICEAECNKEFIDTTKYLGTIEEVPIVPPDVPPFIPPKGGGPQETDPGGGVTTDGNQRVTNEKVVPGTFFFGNEDGLFTGDIRTPVKVDNIICRFVTGKEVQHDDIRIMLKDPFNKPKPDRPLYFFEGNQILIYCNPTFVLAFMEITFLKKLISMSSDIPLPVGFVDTSELPGHTHDEIVEMAIDMILNTNGDPRLQTHQLELAKQE